MKYTMPRHLGIRKRKELHGSGVSNIDKLAEDFTRAIQLGKSQEQSMTPSAIKKKFSI